MAVTFGWFKKYHVFQSFSVLRKNIKKHYIEKHLSSSEKWHDRNWIHNASLEYTQFFPSEFNVKIIQNIYNIKSSVSVLEKSIKIFEFAAVKFT